MNGGDVQRVIAVADAQEAGSLLEGLGADAGHGGQLHARAEAAVFIAELDDLLRGAFVDAGHVAQQRPGRGVEIHADAVDAAFNHRLQRFVQMALVDVMLILADADGLRVDLDQLGQRVLQAARDGDGSADGQVEVGKLLARDFGGGIDGGAGLVHRHAEDRGEAFLAGGSRGPGRRSRAKRCRCRWRWPGRYVSRSALSACAPRRRCRSWAGTDR